MATPSRWAPFPHDAAGYAYPGAALKTGWPRLHAGDCEPWPDTKRAAALLKAAGKAAPKLDADGLATALQDAWRAFHRGDLAPDAHVVIVNRSFVDEVLGGRNPIGQRVRYAKLEGRGGAAVPDRLL